MTTSTESAVLVINCGSSSIKFALYDHANNTQPLLSGLAEALGTDDATISVKGALKETHAIPNGDHEQALSTVLTILTPWRDTIKGIGHRIVHGGEIFKQSGLIDASNIEQLESLSPLAPLHNPVNVLGLKLCMKLLPNVPNAAVFDTAFHQSLSEPAYLYAVPYNWYEDYGVRRYGFHGTSYQFVSQAAADKLGKPLSNTNLLIAHLGNGCSACAIKDGKSVDTSMGLTPLEGLPMGTRSGDVDPGLIDHMHRATGQSLDELMVELNRKSGLLGLSGVSNDMRRLLEALDQGNEGAKRAVDVFCYKIARQLAALGASLPSIDAVVFTGGIGEHSAPIREGILRAWAALGVTLDESLNEKNGGDDGRISSTTNSADKPIVWVIPTDEERMIAQDTYTLIGE